MNNPYTGFWIIIKHLLRPFRLLQNIWILLSNSFKTSSARCFTLPGIGNITEALSEAWVTRTNWISIWLSKHSEISSAYSATTPKSLELFPQRVNKYRQKVEWIKWKKNGIYKNVNRSVRKFAWVLHQLQKTWIMVRLPQLTEVTERRNALARDGTIDIKRNALPVELLILCE